MFIFQLTFEGIVGLSFRSDIAIDNITLSGVDCPGEVKNIIYSSLLKFFVCWNNPKPYS